MTISSSPSARAQTFCSTSAARDRVERRADRDRRLLADLARLAEAHRVRERGERVQPRKLLREHQLRRALRDPVNARRSRARRTRGRRPRARAKDA